MILNFKSSKSAVSRRRSGVILVLVLLMLTLCATIAAQVTSRTIRLSGQAADSQRELQSRWAIVSIRRSILNEAPALLMWHGGPHREPSSHKPIPFREETIALGGNRYTLILQDESAKAPISRMLQNKNQQEVKPILRQLIQGKAMLQSNLPSNPTQWRQVLNIPGSPASTDSFVNLLAATDRMTLWSDGRLNILTAKRETLDAVWRYQFNAPAPDFFVSLQHVVAPTESFETLLREQGLSERQLDFATKWLTTTSSSYSLWISQSVANRIGTPIVYVRRKQQGYAEEHFGFH